MADATGGYQGETKTPEETDLSDLDPSSREMARPHEHLTQRTVKVDPDAGTTAGVPVRGAPGRGPDGRGEMGGRGADPDPLERAHLEAMVRAVEKHPALLELQPSATSDLHRTLLNDRRRRRRTRTWRGWRPSTGLRSGPPGGCWTGSGSSGAREDRKLDESRLEVRPAAKRHSTKATEMTKAGETPRKNRTQ